MTFTVSYRVYDSRKDYNRFAMTLLTTLSHCMGQETVKNVKNMATYSTLCKVNDTPSSLLINKLSNLPSKD